MMKNIEEKEKLDAANRRKAQEEQEQKQADNARQRQHPKGRSKQPSM
ncbi:hypothetical protein [Escherichia coli]|nr:hypothetical protein [Escherichia coli]